MMRNEWERKGTDCGKKGGRVKRVNLGENEGEKKKTKKKCHTWVVNIDKRDAE